MDWRFNQSTLWHPVKLHDVSIGCCHEFEVWVHQSDCGSMRIRMLVANVDEENVEERNLHLYHHDHHDHYHTRAQDWRSLEPVTNSTKLLFVLSFTSNHALILSSCEDMNFSNI